MWTQTSTRTSMHTHTHTHARAQVKHAKISKGMEKVGYETRSTRKHAQAAQEGKVQAAPSLASSRPTTTIQSSIWVPKGIVESEHRYL